MYKNNYNKLEKPKFWLALMIFLLQLPFSGSTQNNIIENATKISTQNFLKDTAAITAQLKVVDRIAEIYTDSAMTLTKVALQSSQQLQYHSGFIKSLYYLGFLYQLKGNHPAAVTTLRKALKYCTATSEDNEISFKIMSTLSHVYWYYGKPDSSAYYSYHMLDEIERRKISNQSILINAYTNVIFVWLNMNDSDSAANFSDDKYMQTAVDYLNKSELLNWPDDDAQFKILFSKAQLKKVQYEYDSSTYFYNGMLRMVQKEGIMKNRKNSWFSAIYLNISHNFLEQKNGDSAIKYAKAALSVLPPNGGNQLMHYVFAKYYIGAGYCLQKKYKEAIEITLPALTLAKEKDLLFLREMAHQVLTESYRETDDFENALIHQVAYSQIEDSLRKQGRMQTISQMEMKYQVADKNKALVEKELSIVKKDNSIKSKNLWIAGVTTGLVLVISIALAGYLRSRYKLQISAMQNRQQMEITRLQATINGEEKERERLARELHDGIGGQLGSMRMQLDAVLDKHGAVIDGNGNVTNLLHQLDHTYRELRKTAHNLMPETLAEEGLTNALAIFCNNTGRGTDIEISFEVVGNIPRLPGAEELALYRMVQELVHNVIKHAKASEIMVQLAYDGNLIGITVEDNGIGMSIDTNKEAGEKGLGLVAMQQRIETMGGRLDIFSSLGKGTSINIELCTNHLNEKSKKA